MIEYKEMKTDHKGLFLEVDLGRICNFRCSYCPPVLHNGSEWIDYKNLISFIEKVKPSHVLLGGGEPTKYPQISKLLKELKSNKIVVDITSNGSKSLEWWVEHINYIDILTLSFHLEHTNKDEFKNIVNEITHNKIVTVNLPMIPERFDECLAVGKEISKIHNTFVSLKALTDSESGTLYQYSQEQLDIMAEVLKPEIKTTSNKYSVNFYATDKMNNITKMTAQKLISSGQNSFKGWFCNKGIQYLRLAYNGDVFRSACELGSKPFRNIYKDDDFKCDTSICDKDMCFCLVDLKTIDKVKQ